MCTMGVHAVLLILLMLPAAVKTDSGAVTFWRESVTLTCPGEGEWFDKTGKIDYPSSSTYEFKYQGKGKYRCEYPGRDSSDNDITVRYHFYVEGKTCRNCFELDASLFLGVLVVDLVMTAIVMLVVCKCPKKKSSAAPVHSSKAPSGGRAQAADLYEHLSPSTRSQETYTFLNKTG